jgi:acyl-CoA thioesterase I
MNRTLFFIFILGAAVIITVGMFYKHKHAVAFDPDACTAGQPKIVAFGDSLIYGYGSSKPGGFVSLLEDRTGVQITNFGHNGDTSTQGLERIDAVLAEKPQVVIVLFGGNDALQKFPVSETRDNLDAILTKLEAANTKVILLGVLGGLGVDPYQGMFLQLAKNHHVLYVPNVLTGLIGNKSYMNDPIHPNDAGYARIADRIYPVLLEACAS